MLPSIKGANLSHNPWSEKPRAGQRNNDNTLSDANLRAASGDVTGPQTALDFVKTKVAESNEDLIDRSASLFWQERQANVLAWIRGAASPAEFIQHIQSSVSGFDHRVERSMCDEVDVLCHYKWALLQRMFPGFETTLGDFGESQHALPGSIVEVSGRRTSNIFLSHLAHFLFIRQIHDAKSILEIGGGYGSFARIFCALSKPVTYVIVDLPTSLLCAYVYLRESLPDASIEWVESSNLVRDSSAAQPRIILVPSTLATKEMLSQFNFDLAINTGSLQEMPPEACRRFHSLVFEELRVPMMYSNNYFLTPDGLGVERSNFYKLVVPQFTDEYFVAAARINNPVLDVDASSRNWLELLVCRDPKLIPRPAAPCEFFQIIENICRQHELSMSAYESAFMFITRFYFGEVMAAPVGWGDQVQTNVLELPEDFTDIVGLQSWIFQSLPELRSIGARLRVDGDVANRLARKEREYLIDGVHHRHKLMYKLGARRFKRKGLPTMTNFRFDEYRRVADETTTGFSVSLNSRQ